MLVAFFSVSLTEVLLDFLQTEWKDLLAKSSNDVLICVVVERNPVVPIRVYSKVLGDSFCLEDVVPVEKYAANARFLKHIDQLLDIRLSVQFDRDQPEEYLIAL